MSLILLSIRNDNPDKGMETSKRSNGERRRELLEMITPIRGRKLSYTNFANFVIILEMITPIRGRKQNISADYSSVKQRIRNDNPDKGTETQNPKFISQNLISN